MNEHEEAVDARTEAALLNTSIPTLLRKARAGEIPGFKVGSRWRFYPSVVREHNLAQDPWRRSPQSHARRRSVARKQANA